MKLELLEHPDVQGWLQSLWGEVKTSLLEAAKDPTSDCAGASSTASPRPGGAWRRPELQAKVDGWIERLAPTSPSTTGARSPS